MTTEGSEIQELRARLADLEATVASLQRSRSSKRHLAKYEDTAAMTRASRRSLLGLLAGAGMGAVFGAGAIADAAEPAGTAARPWEVYLPKLMAEKVDPVLGDGRKGKNWNLGPGQNGHYCQVGRMVVVKTWNQFSVGAQPGEGQYRLSLPVTPALGSDAWLGPTGVAIMHRDSTNIIRIAAVILTSHKFVTFQLDNTLGGDVGHDSPWLWADGDGLNTFMIYEAGGDP